MIYKLLRDGEQIAHGSTRNMALVDAITSGEAIHPQIVKALVQGMDSAQYLNQPHYSFVEEPAFDSQMITKACESGDSFIVVQHNMEAGVLG